MNDNSYHTISHYNYDTSSNLAPTTNDNSYNYNNLYTTFDNSYSNYSFDDKYKIKLGKHYVV